MCGICRPCTTRRVRSNNKGARGGCPKGRQCRSFGRFHRNARVPPVTIENPFEPNTQIVTVKATDPATPNPKVTSRSRTRSWARIGNGSVSLCVRLPARMCRRQHRCTLTPIHAWRLWRAGSVPDSDLTEIVSVVRSISPKRVELQAQPILGPPVARTFFMACPWADGRLTE